MRRLIRSYGRRDLQVTNPQKWATITKHFTQAGDQRRPPHHLQGTVMEISEETADRLTKDDPMFRAGAEAMYRTIMADADKVLKINEPPFFVKKDWTYIGEYRHSVMVRAASEAKRKVLGT